MSSTINPTIDKQHALQDNYIQHLNQRALKGCVICGSLKPHGQCVNCMRKTVRYNRSGVGGKLPQQLANVTSIDDAVKLVEQLRAKEGGK